MWPLKRIDNITQVNLEKLTRDNINYKYGTGVAINTSDNRYEKKYRYRHGIQTELGDIEKSLWIELVKRLIIRENGQVLYRHIHQWISDTYHYRDWTAEDVTLEALKQYVSGIYDDKSSWDYIRFNSKYRPELLDDTELLEVVTECCNTPCRVAKEQIHRWYESPPTVPCPLCNKGSQFIIINKEK